MPKRVVFTFDDRSLDALETLKQAKGHSTLAETVREAVRLYGAIQKQAEAGFVELVVRHPINGQERVLVL